MSGLMAHLASGATTVCRCWAVERRDGLCLGFTDHDREIRFAGLTFRPDSGLTARSLVQGTGLAVDNSEVLGVLSDAAIRDEDILAGRFDGASVTLWWVNWQNPDEHVLRFRGSLGEIRRAGGAFEAELRGLTEPLNVPQGRVFQRDCTAVLGDARCRADLTLPGRSEERPAETVVEGRIFDFALMDLQAERWFERGLLRVLSGAAAGLCGIVKHDRRRPGGARRIELWQPIALPVAPGDLIRIEPGCDKRAETCRLKFGNIVNFQGYPFIPTEDWLVAVPRPSARAGE